MRLVSVIPDRSTRTSRIRAVLESSEAVLEVRRRSFDKRAPSSLYDDFPSISLIYQPSSGLTLVISVEVMTLSVCSNPK